MNKKKSIFVSIVFVVLLILLVVGVTYAFFAIMTNEEKVDTGSGKLDISYSSPDDITGVLNASPTRDGGLKSVATVSLNTGSEIALFNMYITPTALTNLNISAFKWEVDGIKDGATVYTNSGNFSEATVGTKILVVDSYELSTTSTTFNVYIWLDGSLVASAISGASFGAKITAASVPITGGF